MLQWKTLALLGTSHIAPASQRDVETAFAAFQPDIIALELDLNRFRALLAGPARGPRLADIKTVGLKGWLLGVIGAWVERKLGKLVGTKPGQEMLLAARLARERHLPIALIDRDLTVTLRRVSQTLTWRERFRFAGELIAGTVRRQKLPFRLEDVPSEQVLERLLGELRRKYPSLYRALVTERNEVMARHLATVMARHPGKRILAIVGAGHTKDILALVKVQLSPSRKRLKRPARRRKRTARRSSNGRI